MNLLLKGIILVFITANYCIAICIGSNYNYAHSSANSTPLSDNKFCFSEGNLNLIGFLKNNENLLHLIIESFKKSEKEVIGDKVFLSLIETIFHNQFTFYLSRIIPSIITLNISFHIFPFHYFW